jgi:hypothetical protein
MTADIQNTLEYIVYAMWVAPLNGSSVVWKAGLTCQFLSHRIYDVTGKAFPCMGHSQGSLAIQSALTYYPSIRKELSNYIGLAGSLRGTTVVPVIPQANLTNTLRDPAVWQQGFTFVEPDRVIALEQVELANHLETGLTGSPP